MEVSTEYMNSLTTGIDDLRNNAEKKDSFVHYICCGVYNVESCPILSRLKEKSEQSETVFNDGSVSENAIRDICVIGMNDPLPEGYSYLLPYDSLPKRLGNTIVFSRSSAKSASFISSIAIVSPEKNEIVPPSFEMIGSTLSGKDANLNMESKGKACYLCVKRGKSGLPITDLLMQSQKKKDEDNEFFKLQKTVKGNDAVLGDKSSDPYYLLYKKNWDSLLDLPPYLREEKKIDEVKIEDEQEEEVDVAEYIKRSKKELYLLLPLLLSCYSNESSIVRIAIENLYHFINTKPVRIYGEYNDAVLETILNVIQDAATSHLYVCSYDTIIVYLKIAGSSSVLPQRCLIAMLDMIHCFLLFQFEMSDRGLSTSLQLFDEIIKGVKSIFSLLKYRTRSDPEFRSSTTLLSLLSSFSYHLESPGGYAISDSIIDISEICDKISNNASDRNYLFVLLFLIMEVRRYGRPYIITLLNDFISELNPAYYSSEALMKVYKIVLMPALILSFSVAEHLSPSYVNSVLTVFQMIWINDRMRLVSEFGVVFKLLLSFLQSGDIPIDIKTEVAQFFKNVFSITEYLIDAFVNYDNLELPFNPITDLISTITEYISTFTDSHAPTKEEIQLSLDYSEILKLIARQITDVANSISATDTLREMPEKVVNQQDSFAMQSSLYKSTRKVLPSYIADSEQRLDEYAKSPFGKNEINEALQMVEEKGVKKCIARLLTTGVIERNAEDIVKFIYMYLSRIDAVQLGDYLGSDGGTTEEEKQLMSDVRYRFIRAKNWKGMIIDDAIRAFLTECGFFLPGESQKIDRLTEAFSCCFWEDNSHSFSDKDVVYTLTFSIIMLNADAHNDNVPKAQKMTPEEFIRNNRGIDNGRDLDREMLTRIYWNVVKNEIKMPTKASNKEVKVLTKEEKERLAVMSAVQANLVLLKEYKDNELLFDKKRSNDVIDSFFNYIWIEVSIFVDAVLVKGFLCSYLIGNTLYILQFSMMSCWVLDNTVALSSFIKLLDLFVKSMKKEGVDSNMRSRIDSYMNMISNKEKDVVDRYMTLSQLVVQLMECYQTVQDNKITVNRLEAFVPGAVPENEERTLICDGDLTKISHKGKPLKYRFFLFSDILIYAKMTVNKKYRPHQIIPIEDCMLVDIDDEVQLNALRISNPTKSILIVFADPREKARWTRLLKSTILSRIKEQRASEIANRSTNLIRGPDSRNRYRSSSVFIELPSRRSFVDDSLFAKGSATRSELKHPDNVQVALNEAFEEISKKKDSDEKVKQLHVFYLLIQHGSYDSADNNVKKSLNDEVIQLWKEKSGYCKEKVYAGFAAALYRVNPDWEE